MRFSTIFTVLTCGAMAMAAAIPNALVARGTDDIVKVLVDLDVKLDVILPKYDSCHDSECTKAVTLEVAAAVDVATAACVGLKGTLGLDLGLSLAVRIVAIITKIVVKINAHISTCGCGPLLEIYAKIDLCLSLLLAQLGLCVSGIIKVVAGLLVNILVLLKGLDLKLILKVCLFI